MEDSLDAIFQTLKEAALVQQSGGGTGFNFSNLRPKGDLLLTTGGTSSGAVSFIKVFNAATEYIKLGGKRRGANMGILDIHHPDIEEFIAAKSDKKSLRNFNLSVNVPDTFLHALEKNENWELINPRTNEVVKEMKASDLWDKIVFQAWQTGDPGLIFSNTINRFNPTPTLEELKGTNPCGEMPLRNYESCNLGSINLSKMIKTEKNKIILDWKKLEKTIEVAVRFLDNVIDVNHYPLPIIEKKTRQTRKIGLGIMGWAELLILLEIPYASEQAVHFGKQLMQFISEKSRHVSLLLGKEKEVFPAWKESIYYPEKPLRNATLTTIAPTGTISIIANTSSSIEPLFALAYKRIGILENKTQQEVNRLFLQKMKDRNLWTKELVEKIYHSGTLENIIDIPKEVKELFKTSLEIPWQYHVQHLAAFQQHTDNAVSKTINLPSHATQDDVSEAYLTAWKSGAKGITIYRNGSKSQQVLQRGSQSKK
jgi:ribonucleoside-diphosphate reductase alpha chain